MGISHDSVLTQTSIAQSTNWGTICKQISIEVHRKGTDDLNAIKRAIVKAMKFYRPHRFFFNEATAYWWALLNVQEYRQGTDRFNNYQEPPEIPDTGDESIPLDIVMVDEMKIQGENEDWWTPNLDQVGLREIRYWKRTANHNATPRMYAWYSESVELFPIPNRNFLVKMDYIRDLGVPTYQYDETSGWTYFEPFTGEIVSNSWVSEWFIHAEELIRQRAKWDVYMNYLDDADNANKAKYAEGVAYDALRKESAGRNKNISRVPTPV